MAGGTIPGLRNADGASVGLRLTGPSFGLAAGHLQGPGMSVNQSTDHLLSLVGPI